MATYSSPGYTNNAPIPSPDTPANVEFVILDQTVTCSAAPTTSDTLNFGYLPANCVVTSAFLAASDMDTNGSPTITLDVGISGTAQKFFAASTGAQTGTIDTSMAPAGRLYNPTVKTAVVGTAHANAATGAAGTVRLVMFGYMNFPTTSGV